MEPEKNRRLGTPKTALISAASIIIIFIFYYSVMMVLSSGKKYESMRAEADSTEKINTGNPILSDSTYLALLKEKTFLQSRIIMAGTDSIYLTINLADSSANLEISGVTVHRSKFSHYESSRIFKSGDENLILSLMADPFTIARDWATIKKEPVMIKMAPKDTSEYKPDVMPDTSITESVNFILEMTDGTRIYVCQEENEKAEDRRNRFIFDLNYRARDAWASFKSIIRFRIPEYHLYIKICLPRSDAKIIYRAIPRYGQVGLYR